MVLLMVNQYLYDFEFDLKLHNYKFDSAGDYITFDTHGLKVYWCFYRGIAMQGTQGQETISLYPLGNQVLHLPADQCQKEHEYPLEIWHSHGKWPIYRLLTYQNLLNMDIFHGYVRLPEGWLHVDQQSIHGWKQRALGQIGWWFFNPSCVLATSTSFVGINWISMRLQTTIQIYILFRYFSRFFFLHGQITIDWLPPVRWISPILLLGLESPWRWKQVDKNKQNNNIFQLEVAKKIAITNYDDRIIYIYIYVIITLSLLWC